MNRLLFEFAEPGSEALGSINGRTEKDKIDSGRKKDERLLPDTASFLIIDVMDLIKDDRVKTIKTEGG
jgi:hypothetical protein